MKRILIASPVRQNYLILNEFLSSLSNLDKQNFLVEYCFIDDNTEEESRQLLNCFCNENEGVILQSEEQQHSNLDAHVWKTGMIQKVIGFKNKIIDYAINGNYDFLFFVDSDIVLHPNTLIQLLSREKDIISNIFWTEFFEQNGQEPQVWKQDVGSYYTTNWDIPLNRLQKHRQKIEFFKMLREPGVYEVGGLGACTLISKKVLRDGVNFSLLNNVSFWGEDRHFCIRAMAHGYQLYVETTYPAYHIYRREMLSGVTAYKQFGWNYDVPKSYKSIIVKHYVNILLNKLREIRGKVGKRDFKREKTNKKLVLSMIVQNEADRYLEDVLGNAITFVDEVLIIDDASTDNTVEICEKILAHIPHKIIVNKKSMFNREYKLRMKQWKETLKLNPGWILFLDADEVIGKTNKKRIRKMIQDDLIDLCSFRLYDMWNENQYRYDYYWDSHTRYMPALIKYHPSFKYRFKRTNQHCGRLPKNIKNMVNYNSEIKIKHLGWSKKEDREKKYDRYMRLDKNGKHGVIEQYNTILDENPNLLPWIENEEDNNCE